MSPAKAKERYTVLMTSLAMENPSGEGREASKATKVLQEH